MNNGDEDENKTNVLSLSQEENFFKNKARKRQERFKHIIENQQIEFAWKKC